MNGQTKSTSARRDLAVASLILGFVFLQLVQCSTSTPPAPHSPSSPANAAAVRQPEAEHEDEARGKKRGDEAQEEERAKIHSIARALQTIGADPEMQKTYGIKP